MWHGLCLKPHCFAWMAPRGLYGPCHCHRQQLSLTFFLPHRASGWVLWPLMNCLIICFWLWPNSTTSMLSVWHPWEAGRPFWPVDLTEPWVFSGILLLRTTLCGKSKNAFGAGKTQVLTLVLPCGLKSVARSPPGKKSHRVITFHIGIPPTCIITIEKKNNLWFHDFFCNFFDVINEIGAWLQ